ncbi:MAG: hypothetical protein EXQ63_03335 [Ilumatobacteraceae bacterium]|nr:hypothetical protein [Ilumatobacteraceae bacterium]
MSTVAVIDIGTQSTNLLVTTEHSELARIVTATRLGEGLDVSQSLSDAAMSRTIDAISSHTLIAHQHHADTIMLVGTAACRRATNIADFVSLVRTQTGLDLTVIDGHQEASYSFVGALVGLPEIDGSTLVIDIGGGSTEFSIGRRTPEHTASINHGAVVVTEREILHDPPRPEELINAIGAVQDDLEEVTRSIPQLLTADRVVGTAGSIVTIAAVELGLIDFDDRSLHGFELTRDAAEDVFRTLATERLSDRMHNPGLPRARADIIVAGCCVLVGVMRRLRLDSLVVSTHNLLDGIAAEVFDPR